MKKVCKSLVSIVLVLSTLFCATIPTLAEEGESYLCELRLIYAEDYEEALEILEDSEFSDYKLLKENLNEDSGEVGVWLAYKTTDDINDAITDIAIMQMNGGYKEGNYQEMIQESYEDYVTMGEIYLQAIEYFIEAYDEGHFLADMAYRQLNFYNVVSDGVPEDEIPDFEGELLGDIFYDGIDENELATMFMQGNSYALDNIRSLISMGVSYNEDGLNYFEKVAEAAERMGEDPNAFEDEDYFDDYDALAVAIAGTILTLQEMFSELEVYEDEFDYYDDTMTDLEIKYAEYQSIKDRMKEVEYLNGETLYDFCCNYTLNEEDLSGLYPLVAALNYGQIAMTKVSHYYDVIRYSMTDYPEEVLEELVSEKEELYKEYPFNVYTGVDRSIYYGSFALTSEAYRADAYTESGFLNHMFTENTAMGVSTAVSFVGSAVLAVWAVRRTLAAKSANVSFEASKNAAIKAANVLQANAVSSANATVGAMPAQSLGELGLQYGSTYNDVINVLLQKCGLQNVLQGQPLNFQAVVLMSKENVLGAKDFALVKQINAEFVKAHRVNEKVASSALKDAQSMTQNVSTAATVGTIVIYVVSGLLLLYSAISMGITVYNYFHPDYDDVPVAMVDLIETVDGDRYIKYDVVFTAETNKDGVYEAADLNAFEGQRWNALYYTKSYEAGKPLLADEFVVSNSNNKPQENYAPVHRFGEVVCYDLNKYNFFGDMNIYLSVKQSEHQKSAVEDVPELVGSMMGSGVWLLAGGIGAIVGIGGTLATQEMLKKKKPASNAKAK